MSETLLAEFRSAANAYREAAPEDLERAMQELAYIVVRLIAEARE